MHTHAHYTHPYVSTTTYTMQACDFCVSSKRSCTGEEKGCAQVRSPSTTTIVNTFYYVTVG